MKIGMFSKEQTTSASRTPGFVVDEKPRETASASRSSIIINGDNTESTLSITDNSTSTTTTDLLLADFSTHSHNGSSSNNNRPPSIRAISGSGSGRRGLANSGHDNDSYSSSSSSMRYVDSEIRSSIRLSHRESTAKNNMNNIEGFTANKLRFDGGLLHGRDKECSILKQCLDRQILATMSSKKKAENNKAESSSNCCRELVLISGNSGTGKTSLASTAIAKRVQQQQQHSNNGGLYLTGKFDLYLRDEPYSGIAAACRELCGEILVLRNEGNDDDDETSSSSSSSSKYQKIRNDIINESGDEIILLTNMIPVLEEIVDGHHHHHHQNGAQGNNNNNHQNILEMKESFNYAFRKFIRVVGTHFQPLVIMLDDLQWADAASLELVETLITDRANPNNLLLIGCYRSNEVDDKHFLTKTIRDLQGKKEKDGFQITDIRIGNLSLTDVHGVIMALLSIDDTEHRTLGLAEICYKRTLGNPFHLVTFMSMLHEEGLLEFNLALFQWKWDVAKIEEETAASSNVVDLMKEKMKKQPEELRDVLTLASCLGSEFDEHLICLMWKARTEQHATDDETETSAAAKKDGGVLSQLLTRAVDEAFIEALTNSRYRWVHDNVQEAATGLIAKEDLPSFQYQVGEILLRELSRKELDASVFVVANLLSSSPPPPDKRERIAELNLQAAEKAIECSAFKSAAKYGGNGIHLLTPEDKWNGQPELSLKLYSICAEVHECLGNLDEMQKCCDEVLKQKQLKIPDKLKAQKCLIHSIGSSGNSDEALNLVLDVLGQLGCEFPRNSVLQVVKAIAWLGKTKVPTKEVVDTLPLMTDPTRKSLMMLMDNLATYAHYSGNTFVFVLAATRMVRWTICYGLSEFSPSAFALLGIVKIAGGEYQAAADLAGHALSLLDKVKSKRSESRTLFISWFLLYPWTKPLQSTLKYFLQGYKAGMESGDTESACWNVSMYILSSFISGKSLKALDIDCRTYLAQMQELQQEDIFTNTTPFWQGILNLMRGSEHTVTMTGEAMDEDEFNRKTQSMQTPRNFLHGQIFKSFMCNYFGDFELGAELALKRRDVYGKGAPGSPLLMTDVFHQSISLFAMARKTKKRTYAKHARKAASFLRSLVKKGNPNVNHYVALLDAENAALGGDVDKASMLYERAVRTAARTGFVQDAALACERFGEFLLYDVGDKQSAAFRLGEAVRFYSDWGAGKKANILHETYSGLWSAPSEISIVEHSSVELNDSSTVLLMP